MKGYLRRKYTALFIALAMIMATFLPDTTLAVQAAGAAQRSASGRKVAVQNTRGNEDVEASILPAGEATEEDAKEGTTDYQSFEYTGSAITPQVKLMDGDTVLVKGTDYTLSYKNNKNAWVFTDENHFGEGAEKFNIHSNYLKSDEKELKKIPTVVVKFKGNYKGQRNLYYEIARVNVEQTDGDGTVDNQDNAVAWSCSVGNSGKDAVVYVNGKKLKLAKEKDKAGDFYVTAEGVSATGGSGGEGIQFKGNYTGFLPAGDNASYDKSFKIKEKVKWNEEDGEFVAPSEEYNKDPWTAVYPEYPEGGHKNYHGKFAYYYDGNGKVAQVALDTKNYKLSKETFVTALKGTTHPYTGVDITPVKSAKENTTETIKDGEIVDASAIVNYADNIFPGSAKVTFTGIGPFSGQTTKASFKIGFDSKGSNNGVFVVNEDEVNPAAVGATEDGDPIAVAYRNSGKYNNAGLIKSVSYEVGNEVRITGLRENIDYKVTYKTPGKNVIDGDVVATLTGLGAFKGIKKPDVKVGKIRKYSSEDHGITALIPDTDKADKVAAKNIKVFDQDGKAIPKTMYSLKEGEELSTEGGTHKFTVSLALQDKNKGAASEEDVTVDGFYSVYTDANKQIKKIAVKSNYPGIVGAPNFTNDKGAVIFTGEPIIFEGDPAGGALLVTTKGKEEKDTAAEGFDIFTERDETTGNGIYIDPDSYVDNVKKGTGKFTAYGTGEYFGKLTVSFKIAEDPSLEGNSGLSPSEPEPEPQKDVYEIQLHKDGSSENFDLRVGETAQLSSIVKKNGEVINAAVEYSSSASGVATVSEGGLVTGVKAGVANITAGYKVDGTLVASASITVNVVSNVYTLNIVSDTDLDLNVGETSQIHATASKNGLPYVGAQIAYESDDEKIATVSETGLVTAVGKGKTFVKVTLTTPEGNKIAKVNIVSSYKFTASTLDLTPADIDDSVKTFTLSENKGLSNEDVADSELAADSSKITVTSKAPGTTVLTVTFKNDNAYAGTALITLSVSETGEITKSSVKFFAPGEEVKYSVQLFEAKNIGLELIEEFDAIQPALTKLMTANSTGSFEITIPAGTYEELLYYNGSADLVLSGQGSKDNKGADVLIKENNSGNSNKMKNYPDATHGTSSGYLRSIVRFNGACNVVLENLTIQNTYMRTQKDGGNTQAEALLFSSTGHMAAYNCSFKSHQDTIQIHGKTWFYGCYIEGDTDFTWIEHSNNSSVALFENCELKALGDDNKQAYYAAPRQEAKNELGKGQVFLNTRFTEDDIAKQAIYIGRSVGAAGEASQITLINSTYEKVATDLTDVFKREEGKGVNLAGVSNINVGWKLDQATATNMGYNSPFTTESTRDILTEEEVNKEYSGRRAILNRKYNIVKNGFRKDNETWYDVDWTIQDRKWNVTEDTSKDLLDGEDDQEATVYLGSKEVSEYPELIASEGFAKESGKNHWAGYKDSRLIIPVTGKCLVTVTGYYAGEGLITMEGQGSGYYNFNNGTTNSTVEKVYCNYTGAGNLTIDPTANSYITMIKIEYDDSLTFTPVSDITIRASDNATEVFGKKTLQFFASLTPDGVTNSDVAWSIPEEFAAFAAIGESTGLLTAADVTEDVDIQVVCTARDANTVSKTYPLKVKVAPTDSFTITWLDKPETDGKSMPSYAPTNSVAEFAAGSDLVPSTVTTYGTWANGNDKIGSGNNTDAKAALKYSVSTAAKLNYDNAYIDFPVTAGEQAVAITKVNVAYGNHGTDMIHTKMTYKMGDSDEWNEIWYAGDSADREKDDDGKTREEYKEANSRRKTFKKDAFIPIKPGQTAVIRIAVGNCYEEVAEGKTPTIGTTWVEGQLIPTPGAEFIYSLADADGRYTTVPMIKSKDDLTALKGTDVISNDGFFTVNYRSYNGQQHGADVSTGNYFKVRVLPGAKVTVQGCCYGNETNLAITSDMDSTLNDVITMPKGNGSETGNDPLNTATYEYTGSVMATLTFTFDNQQYLHGVVVEQGGKTFEEKTVTVAASKLNKYEDDETLEFNPTTATSSDASVATAAVDDNNDVVITSKGAGTCGVTVYDESIVDKYVSILVEVDDAGNIEYDVINPYDPFVEHVITLSSNDFKEAAGLDRDVKIDTVSAIDYGEVHSVNASKVLNLQTNEYDVKIETLKSGSAFVDVTMDNGDKAQLWVNVDRYGAADPGESFYEMNYWCHDKVTLSLNELYEVINPARTVSENGIKCDKENVAKVTLSSNMCTVTFETADISGDAEIEIELDNGDKMTVYVTVEDTGLFELPFTVSYTSYADRVKVPVLTISENRYTFRRGKTCTLSVNITNPEEMEDDGVTYEWYMDTTSSNILGGSPVSMSDTDGSYTPDPDDFDEAGTYYFCAKVTNSNDESSEWAASGVITVTVLENPITYNSQDEPGAHGEGFDLVLNKFTARSNNGGDWSGSNGATITIPLEGPATIEVAGYWSGAATIGCAAQGDSVRLDFNNRDGDDDRSYYYYVYEENPVSAVITATENNTYIHSIVVDYDDPEGTLPTITAQPEDVQVTVQEDAVLTVAATGDELDYQWYQYIVEGDVKNWIPMDTADAETDTLTVTPAEAGDTYYYVEVFNTDSEGNTASVESRTVTVTALASDGKIKATWNFEDGSFYGSSGTHKFEIASLSSNVIASTVKGSEDPMSIIVDAKADGARFKSTNNPAAQVFAGTKLYIPATEGTKITINNWDTGSNNPKLSYADVVDSNAQKIEYTVAENDTNLIEGTLCDDAGHTYEGTWVLFTCTYTGYMRSISIDGYLLNADEPTPYTATDFTSDLSSLYGSVTVDADKFTVDPKSQYGKAMMVFSPSNRLKKSSDTSVTYNGGTSNAFTVSTVGGTLSETLDRSIGINITKLASSGNMMVSFTGKFSDNALCSCGQIVLIDQNKKILASFTCPETRNSSDTLTATIDASEVTEVTLGFSRGGATKGGFELKGITATPVE